MLVKLSDATLALEQLGRHAVEPCLGEPSGDVLHPLVDAEDLGERQDDRGVGGRGRARFVDGHVVVTDPDRVVAGDDAVVSVLMAWARTLSTLNAYPTNVAAPALSAWRRVRPATPGGRVIAEVIVRSVTSWSRAPRIQECAGVDVPPGRRRVRLDTFARSVKRTSRPGLGEPNLRVREAAHRSAPRATPANGLRACRAHGPVLRSREWRRRRILVGIDSASADGNGTTERTRWRRRWDCCIPVRWAPWWGSACGEAARASCGPRRAAARPVAGAPRAAGLEDLGSLAAVVAAQRRRPLRLPAGLGDGPCAPGRGRAVPGPLRGRECRRPGDRAPRGRDRRRAGRRAGRRRHHRPAAPRAGSDAALPGRPARRRRGEPLQGERPRGHRDAGRHRHGLRPQDGVRRVDEGIERPPHGRARARDPRGRRRDAPRRVGALPARPRRALGVRRRRQREEGLALRRGDGGDRQDVRRRRAARGIPRGVRRDLRTPGPLQGHADAADDRRGRRGARPRRDGRRPSRCRRAGRRSRRGPAG